VTSRRFALALGLWSLGSALLVARLPDDLDERLVTRRHHNSDPLLTASLLQLNTASLLARPSRYFQPPILFPDPNPYRSTEPFLSQALLALPLRLAFPGRPARVYTLLLVATLALVACGTGLLLRELGVQPALALAGGCLSVTVATTTVFLDRLQALSLQWLAFGLLLAVRYARSGGRLRLLGFAACAFLAVHASLYTTAMLAAATPFVAPLLLAARRRALVRRRAGPLAAALAAAAGLSLLVLVPWLRGREDVRAYASAEYAARKPWGQAYLAELAMSPPEYGRLGWLEPWPGWDGVYPGAAFVALVGGVGLALVLGRGAAAETELTRGFVWAGRARTGLLLGFAGALVASGASGGAALVRGLADLLLWTALAAWCVRLALFPLDDLAWVRRALASALWLAALVLLLLAMGSPIGLGVERPPLCGGLFGPLSTALPPLRELRELKRFLLPAGWAAVTAVALSLHERLRGVPHRLGPALAGLALALAILERAQADTRSVGAPAPPAYYGLLARSQTGGGLLELPVDQWGRISSVRRMLWQPSHGRPIVAGKVSLDPAWYTPAMAVLAEFPSAESLLLLQAWNVGAVLDARPESWRAPLPARLPAGLQPRGEWARAEGAVRLFDVVATGEPSALAEPDPGPVLRIRPDPAAAAPSHRAAADGTTGTAASFHDGEPAVFVPSVAAEATAIELDYGSGRASRVPARLEVQAFLAGAWRDVTLAPTGSLLRARLADQLLRRRRGRLVVRLREPVTGPIRLVASSGAWELPELRLLAATARREGGGDPGRQE
jgi:hypothetical protein